MDVAEIVKQVGLSDKAAKVYLAALDLGEATVQELAERSRLKRTTIYYTIEELEHFGAIQKTERKKKTFYIPETPTSLLARARERLHEFEEFLPELEKRKHSAFPKPRVYFLFGVPGFKQIWDKILKEKTREYCIVTKAEDFLDFVNEKYLIKEIIGKKQKLGIKSRQLISDSPYSRKIVAKDMAEGRSSKILPAAYKLPFTEIITQSFVAFISSRFENILLIVENESFAKTQQSLFNALWDSSR